MPPNSLARPLPPYLYPITPIIHIHTQDGDSTCAKQPLELNPVPSYNWTPPFRDGLPTPPNDMTGVAYNTVSASYGAKSNGIPFYPYARVPNNSRVNFDPVPTTTMSAYTTQSRAASTRHASVSEAVDPKKSSNNSIAPFLEIPSSINDSHGNLAEFAAQMTCLFWFEKTAKLKAVEDRLNPGPSLVPEAIPTIGFLKWVTTILSTTQVSQNVILLALLFIYRMKKCNPGVKGKKGSECRLLTIALMLGNKFLDDNTYTNKTWAEVSGISVQEIHIMEVEFLSNIRYNLFVSKEEWEKWHMKLGLFADSFNKASLVPVDSGLSPTTAPVLHVSPSQGPTSRVQPPSPLSRLPSPPLSGSLGQNNWNPPLNGISSYLALPQRCGDAPTVNSRKRGRDEQQQAEEHPIKRIAVSNAVPIPVSTVPPPSSVLPTLPPVLTPTTAPSSLLPMTGPVTRLPCPAFPPSSNGTAAQNAPPPVSHIPTLAGRTMPSSVYNPSPTNWVQQQMPTSTPVPPATTTGLYNTAVTLPEPVRNHQSPYVVSSATVSPAVSAYSSSHTPQMHLSPSFFLANRNSPYRPVRAVNTLLIPPPSTFLQQQRSVPFDHMHYQPLGKPAAERKTGLLPYLHHGAWPQGPFVQPVFHHNQNYSG